MRKLILPLAICFLVGCSQVPTTQSVQDINTVKEKTTDIYHATVKIEVYEIKDPKFNQLDTERKDEFMDNVTSHIGEVPIATALSKHAYKIKNKYDFILSSSEPVSLGDTNVTATQKNPGIMVVASTEKDEINLNVFNRVSTGTKEGYANTLFAISMSLSNNDSNSQIASRIAENEIIVITAKKNK